MTRRHHTILQVVPRLDSGGAERTTLEIAGAIARAGSRALVVSSGGRLANEIIKAGGEVIDMPVHSKNPAMMWLNAGRLTRLIRARGVDLVHARSRAPAWSALFAARRTGVKLVTTYHGAHKTDAPLKRWYNSSLTRSDCVIANSHFTADAIAAAYKIAPRRLRVIPRGVDTHLFDPAKVDDSRVNQLAAEWRVVGENTGFKVLLAGRLTDWKGHSDAIEAAARHKSLSGTGNDPDLTLVFCGGAQGNSKYEAFLRAKIVECGVGEMVHVVGDCADMPAAYRWADIVIAPSTRPEAFGRIAVEAGAMGKPVVASAHGGALETIIDGETGILIRPGDARDLSDAIERLKNMTVEERAIYGGNARARAASLYSAAAMCDATLRVYDDLLAGGE
ncbi:Glycosyltransferase [hydrothermal vent metagenome]|uniref:Glycosyltransferase n=1 Tax=hydrothermal vent metagenome TaxID=652676 RepID=A0A3B0TE18_9ZZZZ